MSLSDNPRTLRVVTYGRVSTEHEAQVSAFQNQIQWYESFVKLHPEWNMVGSYGDEGISGTTADRRPEFMRMIEDAKAHKFDLIITRETSRFARNTVDTLTYVRKLKDYGVEVYFINDGIKTFDKDGELRLTIMASLSQDESRKIHERVLAGQQTSREKHVLYGTGNILGYSRVNKTYVIDETQAEVVRKIFELYASGIGYKQIANQLTALGYKNAQGNPIWEQQRIGRILRNATYMGYICYNKSYTKDFLTHKRVNNREEDYVYVKGDFEPIVSEELWYKCKQIRESKNSYQRDATGRTVKFSKKAPASVWSTKLRCNCGSAFRRFKWHVTKAGREQFGYECYRRKRQISMDYARKHGLDASLQCQSKSIPDWYLDLMAIKLFQHVWKDHKDVFLMTIRMLEECSTQDASSYEKSIAIEQTQLSKLKKQQSGLRKMRALEELTHDEFTQENTALQADIEASELRIKELQGKLESNSDAPGIDIEAITAALNQWIDVSGTKIPDEVIDEFILQVVQVEPDTYNWTMDFGDDKSQRRSPGEIAWQSYWDKWKQQRSNSDAPIDSMLSKHILNPQNVFSFEVTDSEAREFCGRIGIRFLPNTWKDKTVIISI